MNYIFPQTQNKTKNLVGNTKRVRIIVLLRRHGILFPKNFIELY